MTAKRKNRSIPEPPPIATSEPAIIDLIIEDLEGFEDPEFLMLAPHLRDRKAFGIEKYGTPLQVSNERDHRHDAFQEILDFIAYTKQGAERGDRAMETFYSLAIVIAAEFAQLIEGGDFDYDIKKKTVITPQ